MPKPSLSIPVFLAVAVSIAVAQDPRDQEFVQALTARGYHDLLELQYGEWLKAPDLTPERRSELEHGLIRVYVSWADLTRDPARKKQLWDQAIQRISALLAGRLSTQDRVRYEIDLGLIFLNKGNSDVPAATSGSESSRARARQNLQKSCDILRGAQKEAVRLLEEAFALGGEEAGSARRGLIEMTLEAEFHLAWALYGLGQVAAGDGTEKQTLLTEAEKRFFSIAQSCPGTTAANESHLGVALCRYARRDLSTAEKVLRYLLRQVRSQELRKRVYYQLAVVCNEMGKHTEAVEAAGAALRMLPGAHPEVENACRLVLAKALYGVAGTTGGAGAEKHRKQAQSILKSLDSQGGRWAAAAREVLISQATSDGGRYKELAEAKARMANNDYGGAVKSLQGFLAEGGREMAPALRAELLFKLGLCWSQLGDYGEAAKAFEGASQAGGNPALASRAAHYAMVAFGNHFNKTKAKGDEQAYVASLKNILERFPDHPERDDVRYRLARILEEQGKLAAAAAAFEQLAADSPLRRRAADRAAACIGKILRGAWAKNGSAENEADLIAKARALLTEVAAPLPESARKERGGKEANAIAAGACVRLARLLLNDRVNQTEAAIKLLQDFAEKYPGQKQALGDALFVEAWALGKAGLLDKGLSKLRQAREGFPASDRAGPAAITLALALEKRAQSQSGAAAAAGRKQAAELFKLALASPACGEEDSIQMWLHLAELYVEMGDWKQAKAAYLGLHKRYPEALNVREGLARCYTGLSDFKNALAEWRLIEQTVEPGSERWWEAKYMIVNMHYRMRNYKEARKVIRVTKALRPSLGGPEMSKRFLEIEKRCK